MVKTKLFGKELTPNEQKILKALIVFKEDKLDSIKLSNTEISKKTNLDPGYQHNILSNLVKKKNLNKEETSKLYFVVPSLLDNHSFKDTAVVSMIQDKIRHQEFEGLFNLFGATVLGIKREWWDYPEIHYLHEMVLNTINSMYNIKQLKAICLLRDFSKRWNQYLKSDTPAIAKHWLWSIARSHIMPSFEPDDYDKLRAIRYQEFERILGKKKTEEIKKKDKERLKKEYPHVYSSVSSIERLFGKRIYEKIDKYYKEFAETMMFIIRNILDDMQWQQFRELLQIILVKIHENANKLGFYADIENISYSSLFTHMKIPDDKEEKLFRRISDNRTYKLLKTAAEDFNKESLEKNMNDILNINNNRNIFRFYERILYVFSNVIKEPKGIQDWIDKIKDPYKISELQRRLKRIKILKEDVITAVKREKPEYIDLKKCKNDNEIFSTLEFYCGHYVPKSVLMPYISNI
jgi:hypothetical protein